LRRTTMNEATDQGRILVIDDERSLLNLVKTALEAHGFTVAVAEDGREGLRVFAAESPDLVVLDVMMPELDGRDVCVQLRERSAVPILFLTGNTEIASRIEGLSLGADDYLTKPFDLDELIARIEALLRRARLPADPHPRILRFDNGRLVLNVERQQAYVSGVPLRLTPTEYNLLAFLAQNAGRPLTIEAIFEAVWSYDSDADSRVVRWYIWRLRRKIELNPMDPQHIVTEPGIGYRFSPI